MSSEGVLGARPGAPVIAAVYTAAILLSAVVPSTLRRRSAWTDDRSDLFQPLL